MVPDAAGYIWTMYNNGAMIESQVFYALTNYAPNWKHEDLRADSFSAQLNTETDGASDGAHLECERSALSDDLSSLFACSKP